MKYTMTKKQLAKALDEFIVNVDPKHLKHCYWCENFFIHMVHSRAKIKNWGERKAITKEVSEKELTR